MLPQALTTRPHFPFGIESEGGQVDAPERPRDPERDHMDSQVKP